MAKQMTIEKALDVYTDMINNGETVSVKSFKRKLSPKDYAEFCELAPFITLAKNTLTSPANN